PNNPADPKTIAQALEEVPELRAEQEGDEGVARLIEIGQKLEGLYRHASTHAAGVVIGDRDLDELVPLYRDPRSEMPVTQFNMKWVEQAGLMKFDFLGLKTLTVLSMACRLIAERTDPVELETIPLDDAKTFEMLSRGDTVGVFQLESSGMRDALKRLKPDRFEDIIAVVALYRPGPMENIPSFIARKHGREKADYLYPTLEPILKETHGIMIYQEQVMQIAQELAGYSLGAADLLRRAMGKKIQAEMDAQRESFVEGAVARGVEKTKASEIFDLVAKFAGYGFNKSHAAAYAMVAYQTAYLKANYPVEFLAASMTYDMGNTDKLNIFRQELARLDIPLLPPDINRSTPEFCVEAGEDGSAFGIRYALAAIRNVGATAMQGVVGQRTAQGAFKSLADFAGRLDGRLVNKRSIENLACAGAFDSLVANRHQVYAAADTVVRHAAAAAEERSSGQVSLFGEAGDSQSNGIALPQVEDWGPSERLQYEFDAVGFYLSAHPLDSHKKTLERLGVLPHSELARASQLTPGRKTVAGIVVSKQIRTSRKGNRFAFVTLSDSSGVYEVVVFSEVLAAAREYLESNQPLLLEVTV
ncbi:MAG: DNA polymerase III subunit alpha, partial [Rhodovibrionaceae bacterium]